MPTHGDSSTNPVRAVGLPQTLVPVRWTVTGGSGAVGVTTGSGKGVTVTRTGVGAYRVDYPLAPSQAYAVFNSTLSPQPNVVNAETAGQVVVSFAAEAADLTVIQGFIMASPVRT